MRIVTAQQKIYGLSILSMCRGWAWLSLLLSVVASAASASVNPNKEVQPELSSNDKRAVEYFVLPNNLPVLLISDPTADKAAAALDVNVGSGDDPLERAGLAHFLEHMLFLGTEKYPDSKEYQSFIQKHGGSHNAFTSLEHTNYFFDIQADQLAGGLDRFAQFFIAPLFNEKYVDRERNAVHSEFRAKFSTEFRREEDVLRQLVVEGHPLSRFRTGNLDTLHNKDGELRQALVAFYQQYYAASNMRLVVSGTQTLAELKALVTPLFSQVKDFTVAHPTEPPQLNPEGFLPASVSIVPNAEVRSVAYRFTLPKTNAWMKKPLGYLGFLLGHEGEGSLLWLLHQQGWAATLSAGQSMSWRTGDTFSIRITLTPEGLTKLDHIDALVFAYINKVVKQGIVPWRFDELKNLGEIDFRFKERGDVMGEVSALAGKMHKIDSALLFGVDYRLSDFDAPLIKRLGGYLSRDNVLRIVTAPEVKTLHASAQKAAASKADDTEAFVQTALYQVPYFVDRRYKPASLALDKALVGQLALPEKNLFVPKNLSLINHFDDLPQPLIKSARFNAWHASNIQFDVPKAIMRIRLKSALVEQDARHAALAALLADVMRADLNPVTYQAAMAGANFGVNATARGIDFSISGYSDSLDELLDYAVKRLKLFGKGRAKLEETSGVLAIKDQLERNYRNQNKAAPFRQIMSHLAAAIYSPFWTSHSIADELATITPEELTTFAKALFRQSEVTVLSVGNLEHKAAQKMAKQVKKTLVKGRAFKPKTAASVVTLGDMHAINIHADHKDNAAMLYLQGADDALATQAKLSVLAQTLRAPFYHQLRTQQQLGYIVFASYYPVRQMPGIVFLVQSPKTAVPQLQGAINGFLNNYEPDFDTQFHVHQLAVVSQLSEDPKNLAELTSDYWQSVNNDDLLFDRKALMINAIEALEPAEFKRWYQSFITGDDGLLLYSVNRQLVDSIEQSQANNDPAEPLNRHAVLKTPKNVITDYREFKAKAPVTRYP